MLGAIAQQAAVASSCCAFLPNSSSLEGLWQMLLVARRLAVVILSLIASMRPAGEHHTAAITLHGMVCQQPPHDCDGSTLSV